MIIIGNSDDVKIVFIKIIIVIVLILKLNPVL